MRDDILEKNNRILLALRPHVNMYGLDFSQDTFIIPMDGQCLVSQ